MTVTDSDGNVVRDKEMLKHIAVDLLQKLYYEDGNAQPWEVTDEFSYLDQHLKICLYQQVTTKEI